MKRSQGTASNTQVLLQAVSKQFADNDGMPWTPREDVILMRSTDLFAVAIELERTFSAVRDRYRTLRRNGYIA